VREGGEGERESENAMCMCVKKVMHIYVIHTHTLHSMRQRSALLLGFITSESQRQSKSTHLDHREARGRQSCISSVLELSQQIHAANRQAFNMQNDRHCCNISRVLHIKNEKLTLFWILAAIPVYGHESPSANRINVKMYRRICWYTSEG